MEARFPRAPSRSRGRVSRALVPAADDKGGNISSVSSGGGSGDRVVGFNRGVVVLGGKLERDCSTILMWWTCGGHWDAGADVGTAQVLLKALDGGAGPGSPGSTTELLSMANQSIQVLRCCDQAQQSCPRSVLIPVRCRNHLLVTTTIPLRQRVRATFMRGSEFKNPALSVLTEDKIT
jgi:hypothetical protein